MIDIIDTMRDKHQDKVKKVLWFHLIDYMVLMDQNESIFNLKCSDFIKDTQYGTDLIMKLDINLNKIFNIALRIRENNFTKNEIKRYYRDFTIRIKTKHDKRTEIHKLTEEQTIIDWYFYAWENENKTGIPEYILLDVPVLIKSGILNDWECRHKTYNWDGTGFISYKIHELLKIDCIIGGKIKAYPLDGKNYLTETDINNLEYNTLLKLPMYKQFLNFSSTFQGD